MYSKTFAVFLIVCVAQGLVNSSGFRTKTAAVKNNEGASAKSVWDKLNNLNEILFEESIHDCKPAINHIETITTEINQCSDSLTHLNNEVACNFLLKSFGKAINEYNQKILMKYVEESNNDNVFQWKDFEDKADILLGILKIEVAVLELCRTDQEVFAQCENKIESAIEGLNLKIASCQPEPVLQSDDLTKEVQVCQLQLEKEIQDLVSQIKNFVQETLKTEDSTKCVDGAIERIGKAGSNLIQNNPPEGIQDLKDLVQGMRLSILSCRPRGNLDLEEAANILKLMKKWSKEFRPQFEKIVTDIKECVARQ